MSDGGSISHVVDAKMGEKEGKVMIVVSHDSVEFETEPPIEFNRHKLLWALGVSDDSH